MLVGFCILGNTKAPDRRRFFPEGVNVISKKIDNYTIYLYGYGPEYQIPTEEKLYSLYPNGLDQRNIHVRIWSNFIEIHTDWLGSFTCYYNTVSGEIASHWGMLDLELCEWDSIGSYILKKYSFIPISRTLKKGIRRMLANQTLVWSPTELTCSTRQSNLKLETSSHSSSIIKRVVSRLKNDGLEKSEIITPLSGGYDSRFLASLIKYKFNKSFKSYTYSLLGSLGDCFESKVSKVVAYRLESLWHSFDLTGYSRHEQTIIDWSGGFSHVNGDYYEMFADQVLAMLDQPKEDVLIISGIVGDLWCGKVKAKYKSNIQINDVLHSHGVSLYGWLYNRKEMSLSKQAEQELQKFFSIRINSSESFLLELVRAKVALLSFLCYSFEKRGIRCSAPFLDKNVVEATLSLDSNIRFQRKWQNDYFKDINLADEQLPKVFLKINRLAIDEGAKKRLNSLDNMQISRLSKISLRFLLSNSFRKFERLFTRHKITDYLLRKLGYKRSEVLISILKVFAR